MVASTNNEMIEYRTAGLAAANSHTFSTFESALSFRLQRYQGGVKLSKDNVLIADVRWA